MLWGKVLRFSTAKSPFFFLFFASLNPVSYFSILSDNYPCWVTANILMLSFSSPYLDTFPDTFHLIRTFLVWSISSEVFLHCWHFHCSRVMNNHSFTEIFLLHCQFAVSVFKLLSFPLEPSKSFSYFFLVLLFTHLVQSAELQSFYVIICNCRYRVWTFWRNTSFCHISHIWLTKDDCVTLCSTAVNQQRIFFFPFK